MAMALRFGIEANLGLWPNERALCHKANNGLQNLPGIWRG
jgi:hypothetical protein